MLLMLEGDQASQLGAATIDAPKAHSMKRLGTRPAMGGAVLLLMTALLLSSVASGAIAQTNTGEVGGVVKDISGGVVPGATVTGRHAATGLVVERVTDSQGRFFLPALRTGQWDITASLSGFAPQTQKGIVLEMGRTLNIEFRLGVEGVTEAVTVVVNAALLQTTTAEISDIIGNRQVVQFPLNGRNFLALAQLGNAVVVPPGGTRGDVLQQAGPLPNVGGQRSGHNIYLLDGAKVTGELFNNLVINPSVDSIQEFKIQKSMSPAEFGGKGVGAYQCRHQDRRQRRARQPVRVPSQRHIRRT
jgi:carboxypeptidase family protein